MEIKEKTGEINKSSMRWIGFGILFFCAVTANLTIQSIPPVLSLIISDLNITHADAGLLMGISALPGIFIAVPMGALADHYGVKRLNVIGLSLIIAGTIIMGTASNFPLILAGRVITGLGVSTIMILVSQAVTLLFIKRQLGLAMSIFQTNFPVAILLAMNILASIGFTFGWRISFFSVTMLSMIALLLFILLFHQHSNRPESDKQIKNRGRLFESKIGWPFWILAFSTGLFYVITVGIFTFTPDFLYGQGIELKTAGFYTSLLVLLPLPILPFIGLLLDKVKYKEILVIIGAIGSGILILLIPHGIDYIVPLLLATGILNCIIPSTLSTLLPEIVSRQNIGLCLGITMTISNLISIPGLYLLGLSRDSTGNYLVTYLSVAIVCFILAAMMISILIYRKKRSATN